MYHLRLFGRYLAKVIEDILGERIVSEVTQRRTKIESLVAYAVEGYTLTVHCKERKFLCTYDRWYIPNRLVTTYEVFATVAGQAPFPLIEAATDDRTFPKLLMTFAGSKNQKKAAIEAFIDLMREHLQARAQPVRLNDSA